MKRNDRTNEIAVNNQGLRMEIIKYINASDITVKFENGYIKENVSYYNFSHGNIFNPLVPSVYGIGYIGVGEHKVSINNVQTKEYRAWMQMFARCYSKEYHEKYPTYAECTVCEEWHDFQNFAKWYDENYYEIQGEKMCLDKDLLIKGNKIYSPSTCVFIPTTINATLTVSNRIRGKYPIGVHVDRDGRYISYSGRKEKRRRLGFFNTANDAFYAYKKDKENWFKELADKYKDKIPHVAYISLYNREVEIDD